MTAPETHEAQDRLRIGFALDRLWCETTGLIEGDSKERPLRLVAELLEREGVPYALIGGVAVQLHTVEPRSTLDIDVAVPRFDDVPRGRCWRRASNTPAAMPIVTIGGRRAKDFSQRGLPCNFPLKTSGSRRRSRTPEASCSMRG